MESSKSLKIVVAMSGGVDSSTVAAMLKNQGYEVIGITLQLYDQGSISIRKGACCAGQDIYDAQLAAEKIQIPHYVLNYENIFKQSVIDDFVDSYVRGETPIPCVKCNQKVKFNDLFKVAKDLGADFLATGHYVRKIENSGKVELHKGVDYNKDQSYFLFTTTKEQLEFLMFPLGGFTKEQTRQIAHQHKLTIADKPDSQDICFVPNGDYRSVIVQHKPSAFREGDIVLSDGSIIGKHTGIINYTIGQRKGLGVAHSDPLYVIKIDPKLNQVIVGKKEELKSKSFTIKELNWIADNELNAGEKFSCIVKLRSSGAEVEAEVEYLNDNKAKVFLYNDYLAVTPGQACVMYQGSRVLGGGWII